ncbi:MAG: 4Fe-4S dicluster domain-containing protein [Bacteroidales bacterium]
MSLSRRSLLAFGAAAASTVITGAEAAETTAERADHAGVLADTTLCIGCRKCEEACNRANHLPRTAQPFSDRDVLRSFRRPSAGAFTVVNQFPGGPSPDQAALAQTYVKVQCMHCLDPSCVSACIVGALRRSPDGAVVYNPGICMGCRYCQVACPFEVPAYEFDEPLVPRMRKCEFCYGRAGRAAANPACAASCPTEALVFGRRPDLLAMAKRRLAERPDRYVNHVYGEHEVGGTSWLYLTGRPLQELALLPLPDAAPARRTEAIQHGIFRFGAIPIAVYGLLAGLMWRHRHAESEAHTHPGGDDQAGGQANAAEGGDR